MVFPQALPLWLRLLSFERSNFGLGVLGQYFWFCMASRASEIYKITAEELRHFCSEEGLDSAGPVRLLRQRLVDHLATSMMASKQDTET